MSIHGIAAVLVLHDPGPRELATLRQAARLVKRLFVIDNSSPAVRLQDLPAGITHIANGANLGVARALNQGMEAAMDEGFAYALLLDQDTHIERRSVERLRAAFEGLSDAFIVCPRLFYDSAVPPRRKAKHPVTRVNVAISSGSLIDLSRVGEVGLHDEKLFIDYVDFEYCLRAATKGYHTYRIEDAEIRHRLGKARPARLLGLRFMPTHHPPARRYYKTRNMLYVWRRYARTHPRWVMRSVRKFMIEFLEIWLFEERKLEKTLACLRGAKDSLSGCYGEGGRQIGAVV